MISIATEVNLHPTIHLAINLAICVPANWSQGSARENEQVS